MLLSVRGLCVSTEKDSILRIQMSSFVRKDFWPAGCTLGCRFIQLEVGTFL